MRLQIVTPHGPKVDTEVSQVTAPGELGEVGILPGHLPLLSVLGVGLLSYDVPGKDRQYVAVNGGYIEVVDDNIVLISETAETPKEIDRDRAWAAINQARAELQTADESQVTNVFRLNLRIKRAETRIAVAELARPDVPE